MISIITPTYNRAHLLDRLYKSLCKQTSMEFEWIVVDDGSTDDTKERLSEFSGGNLDITTYYKENGGKHTALNIGVELAKYPYIFIVDSDDMLPENSISIIIDKINLISRRDDFDKISGICGLKSFFDGTIVGEGKYHKDMVCNYLDFRYKLKIPGDKAEIFKTHILRSFKFPEFEGEKFCPEALVWNRIAEKYDMFFFYKNIYFCEYQRGGLTDNIYKIRKQSPRATLLYYKELFLNNRIPVFYRLRGIVNYMRFFMVTKL